jgi:hypothetical protein
MATLLAIVESLKITQVLDWRRECGKLSKEVLALTMPGKYTYSGEICNVDHVTAAQLNRLAGLSGNTLLLFQEQIPGCCKRHSDLALPLEERGVPVSHILDDEVIGATEFQRSIDDDDQYVCTSWKEAVIDIPDDFTVPEPKANASFDQQVCILHVSMSKFGNRRKLEVNQRTDDAPDGSVGGVLIADDADPEMIRAYKALLDSPELSEIGSFDGRTGAYLRSICMPSPFGDSFYTVAIRTIERIERYMRERQALRAPLVKAFIAAVPVRIQEAERKLGPHNFNAKDYPSVEEIEKKFAFDWEYLKAAAASDVLAMVSSQMMQQQEQKIAAKVEEQKEMVFQGLRTAAKEVIDHMVLTLTGKSPNGRKKKVSGDMLPNVREFLALFDDRNVGNITGMKGLVEQAKKVIEGVDVDDLRDNESVRTHVAQQFQKIQAAVDKMIVEKPRRAYDFGE